MTRTDDALRVTRAELLAALSVAIDLGLGQPAEHMLRSALLGTRIADRLGLDGAQRDCGYYLNLLMWIGCHADSHEYARWFGDDIAVRRDAYQVDWSGLPYLRFLLGNVARGEPLAHRLTTMATLLFEARGAFARMIHSHCTSAALLAQRFGLAEDVQMALGYTFERYDGSGLPAGARADQIPIAMRVAQVADVVEVHYRNGGLDAVRTVLAARSGGQFDPQVVAVVAADAESLLTAPDGDSWTAALAQAPEAGRRLDDAQLETLLAALGEFVDLKCPFTLGHSTAVGRLAGAAVSAAGCDQATVTLTRRTGYVHDLGRIGVSNQIWSKPAGLSSTEFERVRLHPYLTTRILNRVTGLRDVAVLAGNHHECVDGSGYPRALAGAALGMPDRILAAAVAYQSALEPRPYRPALSTADAQRRLRGRVRSGELDEVAVEAVLHAGGQSGRRASLRPDGLTAREVEVLRLVATGATNRQIASALVISEKTARNHVERTYAKIGVSNRVGASLYAVRHGLAGS